MDRSMGATYWSGLKQRVSAWDTVDLLAVGGLGLVTLLARLPFRAAVLSNFDAINYALALHQFDMRLAQPQAPGYPLYVLLGRSFRLFIPDDLAALVWLSILFSALASIAFYLVGQQMFNRRVGLIAALLALSSTPAWYMSEIASPYTVDLFASLLVGGLCYRLLIADDARPLWPAAIALGLAGALRLQTLIFLAPLFVFAARQPHAFRPRPWRWVAGGLAAVGAVFASFFLPAVMVSGGPRSFLRSMQGILPIFRDAETLVRSTQVERFVENLAVLLNYTYRYLGEAVLPLLLVGALVQPGVRRFWRSPRLVFLLLWFVPAWLVFFFIWPGNLGTVLVSMPPLFLLAGAGFDRWLSLRSWWAGLGWAFLVLLLVWNGLVFTALPARPFGNAYRSFENFDALQKTHQAYQVRLELVQALPAEATAIYTDDFRHLQYYLPQYHTFSLPRFLKSQPGTVRQVVAVENGQLRNLKEVPSEALLAPGVRYIVFFNRPVKIAPGSGLVPERRYQGLVGEKGEEIYVVTIPSGKQPLWTADGLTLR